MLYIIIGLIIFILLVIIVGYIVIFALRKTKYIHYATFIQGVIINILISVPILGTILYFGSTSKTAPNISNFIKFFASLMIGMMYIIMNISGPMWGLLDGESILLNSLLFIIPFAGGGKLHQKLISLLVAS